MAASRPTPYTDQIVFCFVLFFVVVVAVESGHRIRPSRTGRNKTFAFYLNLFDLWRKGEILLFLFFLIFIYFFLRFWLHSIFTTVSSFCKKKEEAYHTHTHTHTKFTIEFDFLSCFLGVFFHRKNRPTSAAILERRKRTTPARRRRKNYTWPSRKNKYNKKEKRIGARPKFEKKKHSRTFYIIRCDVFFFAATEYIFFFQSESLTTTAEQRWTRNELIELTKKKTSN